MGGGGREKGRKLAFSCLGRGEDAGRHVLGRQEGVCVCVCGWLAGLGWLAGW